jgi:hypothetical protein
VPPAGYDENTRSPAIVGELVSGSPSHHDHRCSPVSASTAKMVHDSVLNTQVPREQAALDGPSSSSPTLHAGLPVVDVNA